MDIRGQLPPFHIVFDVQEILEADAPWFARGCFEHEPTKFGMERRDGFAIITWDI